MHERERHQRNKPHSIDAIGAELRALAVNAQEASSPHGSRRRRHTALAVAFLAFAVGVGLLTTLTNQSGRTLGVSDAVAAVTAATLDLPGEHPGEYLYMKSSETWSGKKPLRQIGRESWTRVDDVAFTRTSDEDGTAVCRIEPGLAWIAGGAYDARLLGAEGDDLPDSPESWYEMLAAQTGNVAGTAARDDAIWNIVDGTLRQANPSLTPQQRSAMIGALGHVSGVTVSTETVDPEGRPVIGLVRRRADIVQRIFFDRETGMTSFSEFGRRQADGSWKRFTWRLMRFEYVTAPPGLVPSDPTSKLARMNCPYSGPNGHYIRVQEPFGAGR